MRAPLLHQPALQAGRRRPPLKCLPQAPAQIRPSVPDPLACSFTRTNSFKWLSALARNSFRPRCKWLLTVATGDDERGRNLFRRQVLLVAENQRRALRFGQGRQQLLQAVAPSGELRGLHPDAVMLFNLHPQVHRRAPGGGAAHPPNGSSPPGAARSRRGPRDSILPRCLSNSRKTSCAISSASPRSPVMRQASEKTIDWCSSTSCSKSGCQSWAIYVAANFSRLCQSSR